MPNRRVQYWNEITSAALVDQIAEPADPGTFHGRLRRALFGELRVAELSASASTVIHTQKHIARCDEPVFLLRLPLTGAVTVKQGSHVTDLLPGDFALCDASRPYKLVMGIDSVLLTIRVARKKLTHFIGLPEAVSAIVMRGRSGAGGLASRFLKDLWSATDTLQEPVERQRIGDIALQLMAASYASLPSAKVERSNVVVQHRMTALNYIEANLTDPCLTPGSVAMALGITPRYIHRLFSKEDDSLGRYILRRRLEECADALRDPMLASQSISTIGYARGFNSPNHFSAAFRQHFNMSPREFRACEAGRCRRTLSPAGG